MCTFLENIYFVIILTGWNNISYFCLEMVGRPHHLRIVIDVERIDFHTFNYIMDPLSMYNKKCWCGAILLCYLFHSKNKME